MNYSLLTDLPNVGSTCRVCQWFMPQNSKPAIYAGYLDPAFRKYFSHLEHNLEYGIENDKCMCYWPECSVEAAQISDMAYLLFRDLILTTKLSDLLKDKKAQTEFIKNSGRHLDEHELVVSIIAHQFRFSNYYHVCHDIEEYAQSKYDDGEEVGKIKNKLEDILEALYPKFFSLYTSCFNKHPNEEIRREIRFLKLLAGDLSGIEELEESVAKDHPYDNASHFKTLEQSLESGTKQGFEGSFDLDYEFSSVQLSDILTEQGAIFNDLLLYENAIDTLTEAIRLNPRNRNAYIERAMAYFETDQLPLALEDYKKAKSLTFVPLFKRGYTNAVLSAIYAPENKTEFAKGLIIGTLDGAQLSAVELIPSTLSCCRGILSGLWAFVCSPIEVSKEYLYAAYAIGEFISGHNTEECLQCVVPELRELSLSWNKFNDYSKGQKIGYIIGKYGVEIFAPAGVIKGVNKIRALKRANTMLTLENCTASQVKRAKILEESTKRAGIRATVVETAKHGKILVKSSNVQYHVMQKKHAWERVIKLSGNVEEDFKKVISLLEEQNIHSRKFCKKTEKVAESILRKEYEITIGQERIKAVFNEYIDGEVFLNDAWVVTK